ncbi:hypothetical protein ZWY2020_038716 [Hordeum vulgare]|nr:hypothetical protein ZWY2020_038716 [Hordeum vulgare]
MVDIKLIDLEYYYYPNCCATRARDPGVSSGRPWTDKPDHAKDILGRRRAGRAGGGGGGWVEGAVRRGDVNDDGPENHYIDWEKVWEVLVPRVIHRFITKALMLMVTTGRTLP